MTGGAQEYVRRLAAPFAHRIRTNCGAVAVTRQDGKVQIRDARGESHSYDQVVMACHGDEALALLKDAGTAERAALSAFRYQKNRAVLHRDVRVMPRRKRCWASWVYHSDGNRAHPHITVSYWMNRLQGIDEKYPLFVSLNPAQPIARGQDLRRRRIRSSGVRCRRAGGPGEDRRQCRACAAPGSAAPICAMAFTRTGFPAP